MKLMTLSEMVRSAIAEMDTIKDGTHWEPRCRLTVRTASGSYDLVGAVEVDREVGGSFATVIDGDRFEATRRTACMTLRRSNWTSPDWYLGPASDEPGEQVLDATLYRRNDAFWTIAAIIRSTRGGAR